MVPQISKQRISSSALKMKWRREEVKIRFGGDPTLGWE
jgi:hypothetical protein